MSDRATKELRTLVMFCGRVPDENGVLVITTYVRVGSKTARLSSVMVKDIRATRDYKRFEVLLESGDDCQLRLCFNEHNAICWLEEELI